MSRWGCDPLSGALTAPDEGWNLEIVIWEKLLNIGNWVNELTSSYLFYEIVRQ